MSEASQIPEVSVKNTKDQILAAYEKAVELLEKKHTYSQSPQEERKKSDELKVVHLSSQMSGEQIISHLAQLKATLTKQIDSLNDSLLLEFDKLTDLKKAISIEQSHLEDLYAIKETAHTLSALILTQREQAEKFDLHMKEARTNFEREMEEKKASWKKEQNIFEAHEKELKEKRVKERLREEEDYQYNLEMTRRQESQKYLLDKEALEKELEERKQEILSKQAQVNGQLQAFEELKVKVEKFPQELAESTEKAVEGAIERLKEQYEFQEALKDKEVEGERNLYRQKIASLEAKVIEQDALMSQLTRKSDEAVQQVQTIACRALDTSVQRFSIPSLEKNQTSPQDRRQNLEI